MPYKSAKVIKIIKWLSLALAITIFILEFVLSFNGVDLFTPIGYMLSISWILGLIVFYIMRKILDKMADYSFETSTISNKKNKENTDFEQIIESEIILNKNKNSNIQKILSNREQNNEIKENYKIYEKKGLVTNCENYFYNIIEKNFGNNYKIQVQIPLSSVIHKNKDFPQQYQNELYRTIDIGIFTKNTLKPLLLIEINDASHNEERRKYRDYKVRRICEEAGIKLITFYTCYPNSEQNIVNEIKYKLN